MTNVLLGDIESLDDERLDSVVDIYQQSFPPREQMRLSWWIRLFRRWKDGGDSNRKLVAVIDTDTGEVIGMAYYEIEEGDYRLGYLWYIATRSDLRGKGIGAACYRAIADRLLIQERCVAMLFEIEIPEEVAQHSAADAELARRREGWYRRNGAVKLVGIEYIQDVGWQPAFPMSVMLHSNSPLTAEAAFQYARQLWPESVTQTGALSLDR